METTVTLHLWHDGCEAVIAESAEHARELYCKEFDMEPGDVSPVAEWEQIADDDPFRFVLVDMDTDAVVAEGYDPRELDVDERSGFYVVEKPAREWGLRGPGWFATTEWC